MNLSILLEFKKVFSYKKWGIKWGGELYCNFVKEFFSHIGFLKNLILPSSACLQNTFSEITESKGELPWLYSSRWNFVLKVMEPIPYWISLIDEKFLNFGSALSIGLSTQVKLANRPEIQIWWAWLQICFFGMITNPKNWRRRNTVWYVRARAHSYGQSSG